MGYCSEIFCVVDLDFRAAQRFAFSMSGGVVVWLKMLIELHLA